MKLHLDLRELPWDFHKKTDPPHARAFRERLNTLFADYKPRQLDGREQWTHELTVPQDDERVDSLLKQFDKELRGAKQPVAAAVTRLLDPGEVKTARFIELNVYGDDVDVNNYGEPLNPVALACDACKFPDIARVPNPLLVNKALVKKQDVHKACTALIVRPAVLELLRGAIGEQIETGDVGYVVKGKPDPKAPTSGERLYWVRPKAVLGEAVVPGFAAKKRCPKCKRVLDYDQQMVDERLSAAGPGVHEMGGDLQHFGANRADLAVVPPHHWTEDADHTTQRYWGVGFVVSGALFEHLKAAKVKGIAFGEPKVAHTSAKGEPAFVESPRSFDAAPKAVPAKGARGAKGAVSAPDPAAAGRETAAKLKDVPWDCDGDGYVYFHLTTPEVVILDPMTWEADDSGPHRVRKFQKPGLYRMPVSAIKLNDDAGVAVDSATLLLIDGAFFADLQEVYDWDKAVGKGGKLSTRYHQALAEQIGTRFGLCTTPPKKFKSEFAGDGQYTIDPKQVEPASEPPRHAVASRGRNARRARSTSG